MAGMAATLGIIKRFNKAFLIPTTTTSRASTKALLSVEALGGAGFVDEAVAVLGSSTAVQRRLMRRLVRGRCARVSRWVCRG